MDYNIEEPTESINALQNHLNQFIEDILANSLKFSIITICITFFSRTFCYCHTLFSRTFCYYYTLFSRTFVFYQNNYLNLPQKQIDEKRGNTSTI